VQGGGERREFEGEIAGKYELFTRHWLWGRDSQDWDSIFMTQEEKSKRQHNNLQPKTTNHSELKKWGENGPERSGGMGTS